MTASVLPTTLRWGGGVVIAAVAIARCVVFFAAQLVFDLDPAIDAAPLAGLGPGGSLALDVVLLFACAAALLGETLAGRRLEWPLLALAVIPLPVLLWHGAVDAGDQWRGATWFGAVIAAVTIAHLARDRGLRVVLAAILLSVVGPLLVRGAANVTYEHDEAVRMFDERKDEILRGNGWASDSPQANIFERRLRQRQPSGWFVTPNVYASLLAFGLVAAVGLAIGAARAGMASGWAGLCMLLAVAGMLAVWATGSKGAILVSAAGIVLVSAPFVHVRFETFLRRAGRFVAVACVLGALGAVALRGAVLPESFAGDRSLLFRWHYTQSSAAIVRAHPALGVGPDGYQAAYVQHRVPRNPEEVASAHSVFWDWLASFGVAAVAWIGLAFALLGRAGGALARAEDEGGAAPLPARAPAIIGVAILAALALGARMEFANLDAFVGLIRGLGIALGLVLGPALAYVMVRADRGAVAWALSAGAVALAVHAQIEMTLGQPGAAVWGLAVLGLAAWRPADATGRRRAAAGIGAAVLLVASAGWFAVTGAVPALRQERQMADAAAVVGAAAGGTPAQRIAARRKAARMLERAHALMPTNPGPRIAAAKQLRIAAALAPNEAESLLREAIVHADAAIEAGGGARARSIALAVHHDLATRTGDRAEFTAAIDLARAMADDDPNGLGTRRRLADLLWEAGERDEARAEYRRTLEINRDFALDPLKQLPERERAEVEERGGAEPQRGPGYERSSGE